METFNFDLESNGVPYEADMVSFIVGRHETGDGEAMEPFYHDKSAAISQIIFETTVGRRLLAIHKKFITKMNSICKALWIAPLSTQVAN